MRICHVIWSLMTGGTETMLADIMNEQIKEHEVHCLIINDKVDENVLRRITLKVNIMTFKRSSKPWDVLPFVRLNIALHHIKPSVIHVHGDRTAKVIWPKHVPIVRTLHSTLGNGKESKQYAKICCISEAVRQYSLSQGYDGTVVYNGIKPDLISPRPSNTQRHTPLRIVQVGRIEEIKGQQVLIEAAHLLAQKGFRDVSIDLIGDGSNRKNIEQLAARYELSDQICFLGMKDRDYIYSHLKDYDLFVMSSLSEGFGLTLAEAMIAGLPVITCNLEGPMEVIDYGTHGLNFASGDAQSLADTITDFIEGRQTVDTAQARQYAIRNFSIQYTAAKYIEIYKEIIR